MGTARSSSPRRARRAAAAAVAAAIAWCSLAAGVSAAGIFSVGVSAALAPEPAQADVNLSLQVGWDGLAVRGGVVPVRAVVRLPDDAAVGVSAQPWTLRLTPKGGPVAWTLVLPLSLLPGTPQIVDAALPLHSQDVLVTATLQDAAGESWASVDRPLTALPPYARVALFVGGEHGVRRVLEEGPADAARDGGPGEITWIRLPAPALSARVAAYHDVQRIAWAADAPPRLSAAVSCALEQWAARYGRPLGPRDGPAWSVPVEPPTGGLTLDLALAGALAAVAPLRWPAWPALAALAAGTLALPLALRPLVAAGTAGAAPGAARGLVRRGPRAALLLLAAAAAAWLALGAPVTAARLHPRLRLRELFPSAPARTWTVYDLRGGAGPARPLVWPAPDAAWVAPVWLPPEAHPQARTWEVWCWEPGTGQRRWEIRPPRAGARGRWMDLRLEEALAAPGPGATVAGGTDPIPGSAPAADVAADPVAAFEGRAKLRTWHDEVARALRRDPAVRFTPVGGWTLQLTWPAGGGAAGAAP
jgi:hypothetical protein